MSKKNSITNSQLDILYSKLKSLPSKNPITYELSRVMKQVRDCSERFVESQKELMSQYLLTDKDGNYVLTESTKKSMSEYQKNGVEVQPNAFGFVCSEESKQPEYHNKLKEVFDLEIELVKSPIKVDDRRVYINEERVPLGEVLSNYFSCEDILFLEEIGLLIID